MGILYIPNSPVHCPLGQTRVWKKLLRIVDCRMARRENRITGSVTLRSTSGRFLFTRETSNRSTEIEPKRLQYELMK